MVVPMSTSVERRLGLPRFDLSRISSMIGAGSRLRLKHEKSAPPTGALSSKHYLPLDFLVRFVRLSILVRASTATDLARSEYDF